MKRSLSTKSNNKSKLPKLVTEDTMDYTNMLTSGDVETIEINDEPELDNDKISEKKKSGKKVMKIVPNDEEENKVLKRAKGKSNTSTGTF